MEPKPNLAGTQAPAGRCLVACSSSPRLLGCTGSAAPDRVAWLHKRACMLAEEWKACKAGAEAGHNAVQQHGAAAATPAALPLSCPAAFPTPAAWTSLQVQYMQQGHEGVANVEANTEAGRSRQRQSRADNKTGWRRSNKTVRSGGKVQRWRRKTIRQRGGRRNRERGVDRSTASSSSGPWVSQLPRSVVTAGLLRVQASAAAAQCDCGGWSLQVHCSMCLAGWP